MSRIRQSPGRTSFGADPALYDLGRPPYPDALFDWLEMACGEMAGRDALEIGAGTGLATLPLLSRGLRMLTAVEPDERLATRLQDKAGGEARLQVIRQRFEDVSLVPETFDLIFSAAAFHWLPRGKALGRCCALLRPKGWLALWWPVFHDPRAPDAFDAATAHLFSGLEQDPAAVAGRAPFALDAAARMGEMRAAGFECVQHRLFLQDADFSPEGLAALYASLSRVAVAPAATRQRLLEGVAEIVRDQFGGRVRRTVQVSAFVGQAPGP